jgi:hypothetical protein
LAQILKGLIYIKPKREWGVHSYPIHHEWTTQQRTGRTYGVWIANRYGAMNPAEKQSWTVCKFT